MGSATILLVMAGVLFGTIALIVYVISRKFSSGGDHRNYGDTGSDSSGFWIGGDTSDSCDTSDSGSDSCDSGGGDGGGD